ncbi:hypothetical protein CDAR_534561 [Caerostris darwini]|uniref:Uncharacterized protein n=1 Tax=Caerostris darwini TaxID=1538125 RepID=A0AAV4MGQ7_9ARAC|nr:hypothetical protein CDAR_534561 [Caerostris darwini]
MEFFCAFLSFLTTEKYNRIPNKDNIFLAWIGLAIIFIASPVDFLKICSLLMAFNILDFILFTFIQKRNNKTASSKITQIIIIDCEKLNIDEMIVYPTVEQYELSDPIIKPTIKSQSYKCLSPHHDDSPAITIELRKPTIDQLLCYPTIEQYHLKDNILKPTIHHPSNRCQISLASSSKINSSILIQFGKPY